MIKIAILGFGTVGSALYKILTERYEKMRALIKQDYEVVRVLVRNKEKYRQLIKDVSIMTDNIDDVHKEKVDVVMEATGSTDDLIDDVLKFMEEGAHIITANKALVSKYFEDLRDKAELLKVKFKFEASVAAALPLVSQLEKIRAVNDIEYVRGVVNGTCNFILSEMERGKTYEESLETAKKIGFAESDPSADVDGFDSMRKLRIMSTVLFGKSIKEEDIKLTGITSLTSEQIKEAAMKGMRYKLIAYGDGDKFYVLPEMVDKNSYLGLLEDGENAVVIKTGYAGEIIIKGEGAGGNETSSAMLSDLFDIYN